MVRAEIMDQVLCRITTRDCTESPSIDLLSLLLRECPESIQDQMAHIREATDYIYHLPVDVARQLLSALEPIFISDVCFLNEQVIVMKKGLFRSDIASRLIAVHGLLLILKSRLLSSDQSTASDIFSASRRCFSHPAAVRQVLYSGVWQLMDEVPLVAPFVHGFLRPQMERIFPVCNEAEPVPFRPHSYIQQSAAGSLEVSDAIPMLFRSFAKALSLLTESSSTSHSCVMRVTLCRCN